ncbi:MAG: hypothetical protein IT338_11810 [Thermomicrobiales bacterium]|nr:hypothetical protein [Thermomicrobiales bacterium]
MIREVLHYALNSVITMQIGARNVAAMAERSREVKIERRVLAPDEARR